MDAAPPDHREKGQEGLSTDQGRTPSDSHNQSDTQQSHGIPRLPHAPTHTFLSEVDSDVDPDESEMDGHGDAYRRKKAQLKANRGLRTKSAKYNPSSRMDGVDSDLSSMSTSDEVELDRLGSEDRASTDEDEETGLTRKAKKQRNRRRRRATDLDARIGGGNNLAENKRPADRKVLVNLMINACLIGLWYIFSLSISLYNTWMFSPKHLDFHFPLFTTCMHMLVQFLLASLVLFFIPRLRPGADRASTTSNSAVRDDLEPEKPLMTRMFYLTRCAPCGAATGLDIGLGNMSLKFITLTFYTMCKSSSLAFVLSFAFLFRLEKPSIKLILIITTMTIGVVMMVAGEAEFNAVGFILVMSAAFFSGFRWSLTQILLLRSPATSNPFSSIFFLAPAMFVSLAVIAIPLEGFVELSKGLATLREAKGVFAGICLLVFPGMLAFLMTASEFALLQRTSVVTLSICGIFKEVVTISASAIVFHDDPLTPINVSGLLITIASIAAYNYLKIVKMRSEAAKDLAKKEKGTPNSDTESEAEQPMLGRSRGREGFRTELTIEDDRPRASSAASGKSSRELQ